MIRNRFVLALLIVVGLFMFIISGCGTTPTSGGGSSSGPSYSGLYAYVGNYDSNDISAYRIDPNTGTMEEITGSPFTFEAGCTQPYGIAAYPNGKFLFVAWQGSSEVSVFKIDRNTGTLEEIAGSPFATGGAPEYAFVDVFSRALYISNYDDGNISQYKINSTTGSLEEISGSPVSAGSNPSKLVESSSGKFMYCLNFGSANVNAYSIASWGGLGANGSPTPSPSTGLGAAADPGGNYLYVNGTTPDELTAYKIYSVSGTIEALPGASYSAPGIFPYDMAVGKTGKYLYVAYKSSNNIYSHYIYKDTGTLDASASSFHISTDTTPHMLAIDPDGKYLYVTNWGGNSVSGYKLFSDTGTMELIAGSPHSAGTHPHAITLVTY
jgi:6-phosphogluconolactonase